MYVNWIGQDFESPWNISKEQYETALAFATAILKQTEVIKSLDVTEEEFIKFLNGDAQ